MSSPWRDPWPRDDRWKAFADELESRQLHDLDTARRKARQGLDELLELGDYQFVEALINVTAEQLPKRGVA